MTDNLSTPKMQNHTHEHKPIAEQAQHRLNDLTKPLGSLGQFEPLITRLAALTGRVIPALHHPVLLLFAADHGVAREAVSRYDSEVTEEMVVNICMGSAVSSVMARNLNIPLVVTDVGVRSDVRHPKAVVHKIARGTNNMVQGPAMSRQEAQAAFAVGYETAREQIAAGADALLVGEMGIGNTTAASALTAALLQCQVEAVIGRGTGIDNDVLLRKTTVVQQALEVNHLTGSGDVAIWDIAAAVGGFEILALSGAMTASAKWSVPVILDGFITAVAALLATRLQASVQSALIATHVSAEPGHQCLLDALQLKPLLDVGMRLGEGSGALMAWPLLQLATKVMSETATFEDARVTNPHTPKSVASKQAQCLPIDDTAGTIPIEPTVTDFSDVERDAVYKAILGRRDIRVFLPNKVPKAILERILTAGHHAPSVGYMQPWSFILVDNREVLTRLQEVVERERIAAAVHYNDMRQAHYLRLKVEGILQAPLTICVTNDGKRGGPHVLGRNTIPETDLMSTSCAIENMWLAARAEGVAMGWISIYQKSDVRSILNIPEEVDVVALLTVGYTPHFPDIPVLERAGWGNRLPLSAVVYQNAYGQTKEEL